VNSRPTPARKTMSDRREVVAIVHVVVCPPAAEVTV
jgi:hypothetical protein